MSRKNEKFSFKNKNLTPDFRIQILAIFCDFRANQWGKKKIVKIQINWTGLMHNISKSYQNRRQKIFFKDCRLKIATFLYFLKKYLNVGLIWITRQNRLHFLGRQSQQNLFQPLETGIIYVVHFLATRCLCKLFQTVPGQFQFESTVNSKIKLNIFQCKL